MEHEYIVTNAIPEVEALDHEIPMTIDFEGESYLRQEQKGLLIGTYETRLPALGAQRARRRISAMSCCRKMSTASGRRWNSPMTRFPCLEKGGIKRTINGPMVFAPDGNPLVGPVPGLTNYFTACGVMAGFSQGGGVGMVVANWIIDGEPGMDVFAMDVARFGPHNNRAFTRREDDGELSPPLHHDLPQ